MYYFLQQTLYSKCAVQVFNSNLSMARYSLTENKKISYMIYNMFHYMCIYFGNLLTIYSRAVYWSTFFRYDTIQYNTIRLDAISDILEEQFIERFLV